MKVQRNTFGGGRSCKKAVYAACFPQKKSAPCGALFFCSARRGGNVFQKTLVVVFAISCAFHQHFLQLQRKIMLENHEFGVLLVGQQWL